MPCDSVAASVVPESSDYGQARRPSKGPDQAPSSIKIILLPVSAVSWLHPSVVVLFGSVGVAELADGAGGEVWQDEAVGSVDILIWTTC